MAGLNTAQIKGLASGMGQNLSDSDAQSILSQSYDPSQFGADQSKVQSLLGSRGSTQSSTTPSSSSNVLANAQALNNFTVQANQPAIQAQQASKQPLQDRYSSLLDSIKNNGQIQTNRQTVATNNELGLRGISGDSTLGQQTMTNALNPITQGITNQTAQTTASENSDLSSIDQAIASLKAGNPANSINAALGIGQQETQAQQFQSQLQATQAQNAIANAIAQGNLQNNTAQTSYAVNKPYYSPLETAQAQYYNNPGLLSSILGIGGGSNNSSPAPLASFVK